MSKKKSAGILAYRFRLNALQVLLLHPGGPFWAKKDLAAWTIPKGEFADDEDPLMAAQREFHEETGHSITGNFIPLQPVNQKNGKIVYAWACEYELDSNLIKSNLIELEWPPHSGKKQQFPEADKGEWFSIPIAREKIHAYQLPLLEELTKMNLK